MAEALESRNNPLPSNPSLNEDEKGFLEQTGRFKNIGARPKAADKFNDLKTEAKDKLKDKYRQERESILDETPKPETNSGQLNQGAPAVASTVRVQPAADPNQFNAFHSMNDELQQTRSALQAERQELANERQRMINWYQQQQQVQAKPAGPSPEDEYFASMGIDPEMLKAYQNKVVEQTRQEQQQFYNRFIYPQHVGQEQSRLNSAIEALKAEIPNFHEVIPLDRIRATQNALIQHHGLGASAAKDWIHELRQAYRSVYFPTLEKELAEARKPAQKVEDAVEKKKKEQKAKLAAVPKASHEGGNSGGDWQKAIDRLPSSMGFGAFGREVAHMLGKRH